MWVIGVLGCADVRLDPPVDDGVAVGRVLEEGTPDALGVVAMLNDAGTTVAVLDVDAELDARAARNLVAHRDGGDLFDTVAEIDAVPFVGDVTLQRLVDFARAEGWIPADDELWGIVEGIELTVDQAAAGLRTANGESLEVLDVDVALDVRAATGIVETRPFETLHEVALVAYVGPSAIQALVDHGLAHPVTALDAEAAVIALEAASAGLWFGSESDYPLEVWALPVDGEVTVGNVQALLAEVYVPREGEPPLDERTAVESTMSWAFDRYTVPEDWWEEDHFAQQPAWQALRDVLEDELVDPQVFRFGEADARGTLSGAIDVFVFGRTADGFVAGFRTVSVET